MDLLNLLTENKNHTTKFSTFESHGYKVKVDNNIYKKIEDGEIKFYPRIKRGKPYFFNATIGYLHRWVMKENKERLNSDIMVDHRNNDTTDNTYKNLRKTDRSQNSHNIVRHNIYWHKHNKKWCAEITNRGVKKTI